MFNVVCWAAVRWRRSRPSCTGRWRSGGHPTRRPARVALDVEAILTPFCISLSRVKKLPN
jgi:hypothetical protein